MFLRVSVRPSSVISHSRYGTHDSELRHWEIDSTCAQETGRTRHEDHRVARTNHQGVQTYPTPASCAVSGKQTRERKENRLRLLLWATTCTSGSNPNHPKISHSMERSASRGNATSGLQSNKWGLTMNQYRIHTSLHAHTARHPPGNHSKKRMLSSASICINSGSDSTFVR